MTYDTIRRQYAANASQMEQFAEQAARAGRPVRGMTEPFWREKARIYRTISEADDATVAEHLKAAQQSAAERLQELRRANLGVPEHSVRKTLRERTLRVGRAS